VIAFVDKNAAIDSPAAAANETPKAKKMNSANVIQPVPHPRKLVSVGSAPAKLISPDSTDHSIPVDLSLDYESSEVHSIYKV